VSGGARLIDDSYNANPGSVRAGLLALATLEGQHWLVLGEMRELGEESAQMQRRSVNSRARTACRGCSPLGDDARHAVEAFGAGATWFAGMDDLIESLRAELAPGVTVLVKGSRSNRLERVAAALGAGAGRRGATSMLRYVADWLTQYYSGFNVFSYLTLRAILAALTALLISFLIGP